MKIWHLILTFSLTFSFSLFSTNHVKDSQLFNGEVISEYALDNGLRILLLPRHEAPILTFQVWFKVGSVEEYLDPQLKKTGLAHLFEHMMFRGTPKYPDDMFDQLVSRLGGVGQNASTSYHRTNYYVSIPSKNFERLLKLEGDRFHNIKIDSQMFEKEKGAVVGERRRLLDSPSAWAFRELHKFIYQNLPYKASIIGTESDIKTFTLEEADYFFKTYYSANNATIVIVGDVTASKLLPLVEKYFGSLKSQELPKIEWPEEPEQTQAKSKVIHHSQATSELLTLAYPGPDIHDADVPVISLLMTHLSSGNEAVLEKSLVETGIATSAYAGSGSKPDALKFIVRMVEGTPSQKAVSVIEAEIEKLKTTLLTPRQMKRCLSQDLLDVYSAFSSNSSMARIIGESLMTSGDYMKSFDIVEASKKVTTEQIQAVTKKYFVKEKQTILITKPKK